MDFHQKLQSSVKTGIGLCIGLDPVLEKLPEKIRSASEPLLEFNLEIIKHTSDIAAAYKPNLAFYEAHGADGWRQLEKTIEAIPDKCFIIADGKRGDIGSSSKMYAYSIFDRLKCNAMTVNPYLGSDSISPFLERAQNGVYILALTSNPGAADFQELISSNEPLYQHVIKLARSLNTRRNVGLVIGATKPDLWGSILDIAVDLPLLVPGIGAQGGDLIALKKAMQGYPAPVLVNASRSIIYASNRDNFGLAAREAAVRLNDELNQV